MVKATCWPIIQSAASAERQGQRGLPSTSLTQIGRGSLQKSMDIISAIVAELCPQAGLSAEAVLSLCASYYRSNKEWGAYRNWIDGNQQVQLSELHNPTSRIPNQFLQRRQLHSSLVWSSGTKPWCLHLPDVHTLGHHDEAAGTVVARHRMRHRAWNYQRQCQPYTWYSSISGEGTSRRWSREGERAETWIRERLRWNHEKSMAPSRRVCFKRYCRNMGHVAWEICKG